MLFVGMDSEKLLRGAEPYCNAYPENDLHSPDDPEGSGPETAPRTGVLPPPPPGVSVEYYRLQRAGRRPPDNEDVNREPESSSEDGSVVLPDGIDMGENDGRNDSEAEETEANIRRSRRMAYVLGNIRDDDWPERAAMSEGLVGMSVPPLGSVPLREATGPPGPPFSYDLDAFLFQPPMYDYMSRRRPHQQTRAADETISIGSGGSGGGGTGYPRSSPFPGASAASLTEPSAPPPSPGFSSENRAGAASQRVDELGFKAKFIIDHEQSRAIIKFNPPMCVSSPHSSAFADCAAEAGDTYCSSCSARWVRRRTSMCSTSPHTAGRARATSQRLRFDELYDGLFEFACYDFA
jgi:hypothetical protein